MSNSNKPNCFVVNREGAVTTGFNVQSDERGFYVLAAGYKLRPNFRQPCEVKNSTKGNSLVINNANLQSVVIGFRNQVFTLVRPVPNKTVVKFVFCHPENDALNINGRKIRFYAGVKNALVYDHKEGVVELFGEEKVVCFYADGWVRSFHMFGNELYEYPLTAKDMLFERIQSAWDRLNRAVAKDKLSEQFLRVVLSTMADLFHFTTIPEFKEIAQELRLQLLKNFFLVLPKPDLLVVKSKLAAILYELDPALVSMLYVDDESKANVLLSLQVEQQKREPSNSRAKADAKKAAKAEAARQLRNAMKGSKQGSSQKHTQNPKEQKKRDRKAALRK